MTLTASTEELLARRREILSPESIARLPWPAELVAEAEAIEQELKDRNEVPCGWCNAPSPFGMCEKCSAGIASDRS